MATVAKKICDGCGGDHNVEEVVIIRKFGKTAPYGVDMCGSCYTQAFGLWEKKSHTVKQANVRPPTRMVETKLSPEQLG